MEINSKNKNIDDGETYNFGVYWKKNWKYLSLSESDLL